MRRDLYDEALYDCQFETLGVLDRSFFFHCLFFPAATVMALLRVMTVLLVKLRQRARREAFFLFARFSMIGHAAKIAPWTGGLL
jgi:hypothetical protein